MANVFPAKLQKKDLHTTTYTAWLPFFAKHSIVAWDLPCQCLTLSGEQVLVIPLVEVYFKEVNCSLFVNIVIVTTQFQEHSDSSHQYSARAPGLAIRLSFMVCNADRPLSISWPPQSGQNVIHYRGRYSFICFLSVVSEVLDSVIYYNIFITNLGVCYCCFLSQ